LIAGAEFHAALAWAGYGAAHGQAVARSLGELAVAARPLASGLAGEGLGDDIRARLSDWEGRFQPWVDVLTPDQVDRERFDRDDYAAVEDEGPLELDRGAAYLSIRGAEHHVGDALDARGRAMFALGKVIEQGACPPDAVDRLRATAAARDRPQPLTGGSLAPHHGWANDVRDRWEKAGLGRMPRRLGDRFRKGEEAVLTTVKALAGGALERLAWQARVAWLGLDRALDEVLLRLTHDEFAKLERDSFIYHEYTKKEGRPPLKAILGAVRSRWDGTHLVLKGARCVSWVAEDFADRYNLPFKKRYRPRGGRRPTLASS
jgi:hypothetical protein